ncbi:MAG: tetratricopeptide repeat protein [Bacteroidia bacterium]|nr:tetratricopeptide repeat protein [Bacteroidia bacterium]MCC6767807.1 tetratricopeptide repeat protein [Bacteroidia bacterium]
MPFVRLLVAFMLLSALMPACRSRSHEPQQKHPEKALSDKEKLEFSFHFYEGIKEKTIGNLAKAQAQLQQAIRVDPRNDAAHYELSQIYLLSGNTDLAKISGELALRFNPDNIWYKKSLAEIYETTGDFSKQIRLLNEIAKQEPQSTEALYALADAYGRAGKFEDALRVCEQIEAREGTSEEILIQKKNLYLRLNKPSKAIEEINKLIKLYPDEPGFRGLLAEIYLYEKKPDKALEQYQEILRLQPANPTIRFSLAEFYRAQGDNKKSFDELKLAFGNPEADVAQKIHVLSSYFIITEKFPELRPQAFELCRELVQVHPDDARAHSIYGDFLFREEQYHEALEQYESAVAKDKSRFTVWNQLLLTLNELDDAAMLNAKSTEAAEIFPQQPVLYLYKGLSFMQLKKYDDAVDALKAGLMITVENEALTVQFLASLGDSYHRLGRYDESDEAYESALKSDPDNAYVLNNYAYYLSIRKVKLTRAEEMARRCNDMNPGKPSYLDTYAWVLFQSGKTDEALLLIEKAIASGGDTNSTIVEHLGDIQWTLNKKDAAIESWKKAKSLGGEVVKLDKKISEGLGK